MKPSPNADEWITFHDLSHDRLVDCFQGSAEHPENPPKILIEQYESHKDYQERSPSASIWLYPEDIPGTVKFLQQLLGAFRLCKANDAAKSPRPYWGDLDDLSQSP